MDCVSLGSQSCPPTRPPAARGRSARRSAAAGALLALALASSACFGPKVLRNPVYSSETIEVQLRRTVQGGEVVSQGYEHPATISDVRLAHILANIEHRDAEGNAVPTILSEQVYELAEALGKAAKEATPDDEIAALALVENRRLGIFTDREITSFSMHFRDGDLVMQFYDIGRPLEPDEERPDRRLYLIPSAEPGESASFRLTTGQGRSTEGARKLIVDWRDPYFAKPVALSVRGGRFQRRSVLSEAPVTPLPPAPAPPESGPGAAAPVDPALRDAQLRALDQLDAARRSGVITEADFQKRRRLVLDGALEEAGYGTAPR